MLYRDSLSLSTTIAQRFLELQGQDPAAAWDGAPEIIHRKVGREGT